MLVMVTNSSGIRAGYLAGRFEGRIGWLVSPGGWRIPPSFIEYGLDNGAFTDWDEAAFYKLLDTAKASGRKPLFVAVPDVVGSREKTLVSWAAHNERVKAYGWPLAFVVQDGMTESDVPEDADWIFVGGTTEWKWRNLKRWQGKKLHVGRVNSYRMLWMAHKAGALSCDGTGWFRGGDERLRELVEYLEESTHGKKQQEMFAA